MKLETYFHARQFGKVESGAQMDILVSGAQGVGEKLVGMEGVELGRWLAETDEVAASCLPAIGGDGESQLYILGVSGGDVGVCRPYRLD